MTCVFNRSASHLFSRVTWIICGAFLASAFHIAVGLAQVPTPPITSSGLNTQISASATLPNGQVSHNITGGTRADGNLFHSFGNFNVPTNNIANFLNETALPTSNILGRVTGGNPSSILGAIQTTGFGNANLFLMNPAGIVFGPSAALNVGGSVAFTTADYLRLAAADGSNAGIFHAETTSTSLLTSASVAAFGFLGTNPSAISVQGTQESKLRIEPSQSISLIGGNQGFTYANPDTGAVTSVSGGVTMNGGILSAPSGEIFIASVASPGEILGGTLDQVHNINGQSFGALGTIQILQQSRIDTSGNGGGTVLIRGGRFVIDDSRISANTTGLATGQLAEPLGQGIDIQATQDASIQNAAVLETNVASGAAFGSGGVRIEADRISIRGISGSIENFGMQPFTSIKSHTQGPGNAGNIILRATGDINVTNVVSIETSSGFDSTGTTGSPTLASGNAGNVELTSMRGNILVTEGGRATGITSQTLNSSGNTGKVTASAPEGDIVLDGANVFTATLGSGGGGQVKITAKNLQMNAGLLSNDNEGPFKPGGIMVTLTGNLTVADASFIVTSSVSPTGAAAADINLAAKDIVVTGGSRIDSSTFASGPGGHIKIVADTLQIIGGSQIASGSTIAPSLGGLPQGIIPTGPGGDITIQATAGPTGTVLINGPGSGIFATTEGTGPGGEIELSARSLTIQNGGAISASTDGTAPSAIGGSIIVTATDHVALDNGASITASSIGPGDAGNVTISSDRLTVASGGRIEASTSGAGDGGSIGITTTGDVTVTGLSANGQVRSGIFAKTLSGGGGSGGGSGGGGGGSGGGASKPGKAGDITIEAKNLLLNGGAQIDSSTTSGGAGGTVSIRTTENITIAGSSTRLTSDATRGDGKGGNITLVAKNITVRDSASVTAATGGKGDAGNISLTALDQLLLQSAGTITTSTSGSGKGGTIVIQASQVLLDGKGTAITADTLRPFADMTITINVLHLNDGDLVVQLDSPTGTRVALLSRVGEAGDNFANTRFNDQATTQITSGSAPFTGTFTPREPLGQLNNELVAGNWALNVRDQATGNVGSLESWTLQIGQQTFQSTGGSMAIPDNGNVRSTITVANPTVLTVQGIGEATGIGGNVTINAETVTLQNGATMLATTRGSGQGGNIALTAGQSVAISNGASISVSSTGPGNAGNISINAGQSLEMRDSSVTAKAEQASGGNIKIEAVDRIRLVNSVVSSSVADGPGGGGNILIDPQVVALQDSKILAQAADGQGGAIKITTSLFLQDVNSKVNADAGSSGLNGTVTIQSPTSNLSESLGTLPSNPSQAHSLLTQRCAALVNNGQASSFVVAGREQLPSDPGGWLSSPLALVSMGESLDAGPAIASTPAVMAMATDDTGTVSLRRLTPAGFLMANFAESEATGCRS